MTKTSSCHVCQLTFGIPKILCEATVINFCFDDHCRVDRNDSLRQLLQYLALSTKIGTYSVTNKIKNYLLDLIIGDSR